MDVRYEILKELKEKGEKGEFVSGRELGERLGVSRAAVWKHIEKLKGEGYVIKSVNNRGYLLLGGEDILNEAEVSEGLAAKVIGRNVIYYDRVGSTNDKLKELAEDGCPEGSVLIAGEQFKGKGRRGRLWSAEEGSSVAMSILLRPDFAPELAANLTLLMGMAVNRALREVCGVNSFIKWPNDIIIGGKKVCGILLEMATEEKDIKYVVCGVGVNVSNKSFPTEISETATSLYIETGKKFLRKDIIRAILKAFEEYYLRYTEEKSFNGFLTEYEKSLINLGREVKAIYENETVSGRCEGVTGLGELIIELKNGEKRILRSGEVSVRGVYNDN